MSFRVLFVTSQKDLQDGAEKHLAHAGIPVKFFSTAETALNQIWKRAPDIVLLDSALEGMSGLDALRVIRGDPRTRRLPVIFISDRNEASILLSAYQLDADDCVVTPLQVEELVARTKAVMARHRPLAYDASDVLRVGSVQISPAYHKVMSRGKEVKLTAKEYELLLLFVRKEGRVLSRDYLLETLWGLSREVRTRSVDMLVARLRKKLRREGPRLIETVQNYGYRIATTLHA